MGKLIGKIYRVLMKYRRHFVAVFLIMSTAVAVYMIFYLFDLREYKEKIAGIEITEIDLNTIDDGIYIGEYDAGYIYAQVQVTVKNHQFEDITLLQHVNDRGKPAEVIVSSMVKEQRIDVDAVSHATNSSRVIQQACINALQQACINELQENE